VEGHNIRLTCDTSLGGIPRLEGWGAGKGPQPIALRLTECTGTYLKSYRDEPEAPNVTGDNRGTSVKYLKGTAVCSLKRLHS